MLTGIVHEASIQDRDGAPGVIGFACESFPTIPHIFADSGYAGEKLETALAKMNGPAIEIVNRPDGAKGFVLVARRWLVERTLSWINRCRRLAKDWEASIASSEAWLLIASIRQLSRRLARLASRILNLIMSRTLRRIFSACFKTSMTVAPSTVFRLLTASTHRFFT